MNVTGPLRHSDAVEDYAKAIYALAAAKRRRGLDQRPRGAAAVTAPSVSGMVKKLAEAGLVEHVPYKGVAPHRRG